MIDKQDFDNKCKAVIDDINAQKISNPVWGWMFLGAMTGFLLSCIKIGKKEVKPIIGSYRKFGGGIKHGKFERKRDM